MLVQLFIEQFNIHKKHLLLFVTALSYQLCLGQLPDLSNLTLPHAEVDSSYLSTQSTGWSIRAYSTFKVQGVILANKESNRGMRYVPIALYSVGLGITYKYVTLDFGFNPVSTSDVENSRIALVGSMTLPRSVVDASFHRYRGYNLRNHRVTVNRRRSDIINTSLSVDYVHLLNLSRVNIMKILQGGNEVKKGGGSWGLGGFMNYHRLKADSSLVHPVFEDDFNDPGQIRGLNFFQMGILAGYNHVVRLPKNFFYLIGVTPGIGFNFGEVRAVSFDYEPRLWMAKILAKSGLGYSGKKHYYILSVILNGNYVDIGRGNTYGFTSGQMKLVMGFRINKSIRQVEKILGEG